MNSDNLGRVSAQPINQNQYRYTDNASTQDNRAIDSQQRRNLDNHDSNVARTTDKAANDNLRVGERSATTDVVKQPYINISPASEYKGQYQTEMKRNNYKPSPKLDKTVAGKMYQAGYSPAQIQRAMRRQSPACAKMSDAQFKAYYAKHIQPTLASKKAINRRQAGAEWKQKHGIPQTFNNIKGLDKITKLQQQRNQAIRQAKGKQERAVIGQNRIEGAKAQAIKAQSKPQTPQKPQAKMTAEQYKAYHKARIENRPRANAQAAKERERRAQQQKQAQTQSRTRSRTR